MKISKKKLFQYLSYISASVVLLFIIYIFTADNNFSNYIITNYAAFFITITSSIVIITLILLPFIYNHFEKIKQKNIRTSTTESKIVKLMPKLSELCEEEIDKHIERTTQYVKLITIELKKLPKYSKYITSQYINDIIRSAPLHDIGKVIIPEKILLKAGKLTAKEYKLMTTHTDTGASLLKEQEKDLEFNSFLKLAVQIAGAHHENWDGSGYPEQLKKDQIPLSARIMALSDVYDALRSKRPYKEPIPHSKAVELIKADSGIKFDPDIVDVFLLVENDFNDIYENVI